MVVSDADCCAVGPGFESRPNGQGYKLVAGVVESRVCHSANEDLHVEELRHIKSSKPKVLPLAWWGSLEGVVLSQVLSSSLNGRSKLRPAANVLVSIQNERLSEDFVHSPYGGHVSLVVKVTDSWLACRFESSTCEYQPCRGGRCTLNLSRLKCPPIVLMWKLIEGAIGNSGRGSLVVKVTNSWLACQEFESSTAEDQMELMHVKYVEGQTFSRLCGVEGCGSPVVKVSDHGRHVMSSSPVPIKTRRVGQRCTLNLSRVETSSHGVTVRRGGASSGVVHVT
ncbi:hypothetical protein TNCV_3561891 [Trichonephila clavipes]|nr:hypothetical protein TNCV_3561891 [Trichonephila clavipes]